MALLRCRKWLQIPAWTAAAMLAASTVPARAGAAPGSPRAWSPSPVAPLRELWSFDTGG